MSVVRSEVAEEFCAARLRRYRRLGVEPPAWVVDSRPESQRARARRLGMSRAKLMVVEAADGGEVTR